MKISKILTTIAVCSLAFTASSCKNKQAKNQQPQYDAYGKKLKGVKQSGESLA